MEKESQITFESFDKLKLKSFGKRLFQVIEKGIASSILDMGQRGGCAISLNAEFGNGKTTFLKMFEHFVKEEKKDKGYDVLFVNAWKSDFCEEPVLAILSEFMNWLKKPEESQDIIGKIIKNKTEIIKIISRASGIIANQWIRQKTDWDIKEIIEGAMPNQGEKTEFLGKRFLDNFNKRKEAIEQVKKAFLEYTKKRKLLIIVDELDRARPDYAVRFLEDMKHFFDIENVAFLVAVNRGQMEKTVKCLYGQDKDSDFDGYYRKFFKQEMDLPDPLKKAEQFVNDLIRKTKTNYDHAKQKSPYLSCKMFGLTLREIEIFMRIFENILESAKPPIKEKIDCYSFFICLFLKEKETFQKILNKELPPPDFHDFLKDKIKNLSPSLALLDLSHVLVCSFHDSIGPKTEVDIARIVIEVTEHKCSNDTTNAIIECMYPLSRFSDPSRSEIPIEPFAYKICNKISQCLPEERHD